MPILPAHEEVSMETVTSRIAISENQLCWICDSLEIPAEFRTDVDHRDGMALRTHPTLRAASGISNVALMVSGVEVLSVPAAWEARMSRQAAAIESLRHAVHFATVAVFEQNSSLPRVGFV